VRRYRTFGLQVGLLTWRRRTLALRPADSEIGRMFDLPSPGRTGLSVYLDARQRAYRRMDYYGLDLEAPEIRADYALTGYSADLVAQWQHSPGRRRVGQRRGHHNRSGAHVARSRPAAALR
jgi:hypothetical protein